MTCREIQNLLPGYRENHLSEEERGLIESHLTLCSLCRQSLVDLKETEDLLNHLEEVEPPAFFEQRIMSRIREEAGGKKSLLRKIFFPIYIKIPLQAMATILITVLAVYIYQKNEPEMRPILSFPTQQSEQPQKNIHEAESPQPSKPPDSKIGVEPKKTGQLPKAPLPSSSASGEVFQNKDQSQFAAAPPAISRGGAGDSVELIRPKEDERLSVEKVGPPLGILREKEDFAQKQAMGQPRFEVQEPTHPSDAQEKEGKKKSEVTDKGTIEKRALFKSPPAPASSVGAAKEYPRAIDLNLQVKDTELAVSRLENLLNKMGARVVERTSGRDSVLIKTEMPYSNFSPFLNQLEEIGRVNFNKENLSHPVERVTIQIHISKSP
jgi:hypothetical protein